MQRRRERPKLCWHLAPMALTVAATAADAQETTIEAAIEEIVVTATRRAENLRSVPVSVRAFTAEELTRLAARDFSDYVRSAPGVSFRDLGIGGENQTIRGTSSSVAFEVNATTALYLDEVPVTTPGGIGGPYSPKPLLYDIERIEVLRGPQGTLFGASALGGAIRIITRKPEFERRQSEVSALVSAFRDGDLGYELSGMTNLPFNGGNGALRAVGYVKRQGGFIDNLATGQADVNNLDTDGARVSISHTLGDRGQGTLRVAYQNRDSDGNSIEDIGLAPRQQDRSGEANGDEWTNTSLLLEFDLDAASFLSSTSYMNRNVDTAIDISPFLLAISGIDNLLNVRNTDDTEEFIQEFRLVSDGSGSIDWVAGAFFQDQRLFFGQNFPSPGFDDITGGLAEAATGVRDNLFVGRSRFTLEQIALYGELEIGIATSWGLTLGARWFDIDRDFDSANVGLLFAGDSQAAGSASETGATPKAVLSFDPDESRHFYVSATKGFRPGGVNPPEGSNDPLCIAELQILGFNEFPISYESDSIWSYEVGAKVLLLDKQMSLNVAAYHSDWSEIQANKFLQCGVTFIENVAEATVDGVEIDASMRVSENFLLSFGLAHTDAVLSDDVPNFNAIDGTELPSVPRWTAYASAHVDFADSGGANWFAALDYWYAGSSYNGVDSATRVKLPSYNLANVQIGLRSNNWSASLFLNNLFDERGLLGAETTLLGNWETATPPLNVGVRVTRQF